MEEDLVELHGSAPQKKSWFETMTSCLPCFGPRASLAAVDLESIDEGTYDDNQSEELSQKIRAKELELIQAEQRLSATNLTRDKLAQKLNQLEAEIDSQRKKAGIEPTEEQRKRLADLESSLQRLNRKLASVEKYKGSLESENTKTSQALQDQKSKIQSVNAELSKVKQQNASLQSQLNQLGSPNSSSGASKDEQIKKLREKVAQLEQEAKFSEEMQNKLGTGAISNAPVRRGRVRPAGFASAPAPTPEEEKPPSPGGMRRSGSIADRAKMFGN